MKKLKKIFAVLLTLAMVLGMSMTTFAADYTIKVTGLEVGTNVSYVQIVQQDDDKSTGKDWELTQAAKDAGIGMTADQLNGIATPDTNASTKTINESLTNLDFSNLTATQSADLADAKGEVSFTVRAPGLYAIKANTTNNVVYSWMLAYVGVNQTTANVVAKGATNQVSKALAADETKTSVANGDVMKYTVTVNYPFFAENLEDKSFTITDTLTGGVFTNTAPVISGGAGFKVTEGYANTNTLTITLDMDEYNVSLAGNEVTITYEVQATGVSNTQGLENTVKSEIKQDKDSTDPGDKDETESKVIIPSFDVEVSKTNAGGDVITTSEAEFQLYVADEQGSVTVKDVNGKDIKVTAVGSPVPTVDGVAKFTGLASATDKTYYVKETKAPEGYALQDKAYQLTGAAVDAGTTVTENGVKTTTYAATSQYDNVGFNDGLNFHDDTLSSLPSTGGIGTTIFTIGGCAIMVIAAALFFASRRKSAK